jgi:hypothetical protein
MRHTCAVSKDRAGSAPAAASAYFTDSSYVRTVLQLVNKQMGLTPRGLPIPHHRNRTPARPRSPSSFDLSNALCNNPAWRKVLRGYPCPLSTANSQESVASPKIRPKMAREMNSLPGLNLAERDGKVEHVQLRPYSGHFGRWTGPGTSFDCITMSAPHLAYLCP